MSSLVHGLVVQMHVVHALLLRETRTRFGANQLGYLWALLEPVLWIATFWVLYAVGRRQTPGDMDAIGFLATGILTFELFSKTASRAGDAINANRPLLFYPQVQPLDLVIARSTLEIATFFAVFVLVMSGNVLVNPEVAGGDDLLKVVLGLTLAGALGATFGLVLCMLGVMSPMVERLRVPLMRPLFWISGLFYTVQDAPTDAQPVLLYNPVLHVIELVRDGWFPSYTAEYASPAYVAGFVLAFALLGLLLERAVRRRIELS